MTGRHASNGPLSSRTRRLSEPGRRKRVSTSGHPSLAGSYFSRPARSERVNRAIRARRLPMVGIRRLIAGSAGTLLVGMFAGFAIASAAGVLIQDTGLSGGRGESPSARAYMLALLQQYPNSIVAIRPNQSIAQRAAELQAADS